VPPCTCLPPDLLQRLGTAATSASLVWYAVVERQTTQKMFNTRKAVIAVMTHTGIYIMDHDGTGIVTRMIDLLTLTTPIRVGRASSSNPIESVLLSVDTGEPDLLLHFVGINGKDATADGLKLAATINRGSDSSPSQFLQRVTALRDAFKPDSQLQLIDVPPGQMKGMAQLERKPVGKGGPGKTGASSAKDKVAALEQRVKERVASPPRLPPATEAAEAMLGRETLQGSPSGVHGGDGGGGGNEASLAEAAAARAAIGEALAALKAENESLKEQVAGLEDDRSRAEDELVRMHDERDSLLETQELQQQRIEELTDAATSGRASADDVSQLVKQLLSLQKQLLAERSQRQALIDEAVASAEARYDRVIVRQQDELAEARARVAELEGVFNTMKDNVRAVATSDTTSRMHSSRHSGTTKWRSQAQQSVGVPSDLSDGLDPAALRYSLLLDA
jgi:hypothetical protein